MTRRFDDVMTPASVRRWEPARTPAVGSDVWPAVLQGLFVGIIGGGLLGGLAVALGGSWWAVPACMAVLALAGWLWRQPTYDRTLHGGGEQIIGQAPTVLPAETPEPREPILVSPYQGRQAQARDRLRGDLADMLRFVELAGRDSTARALEPTFGRTRARQWRDALIGAGWASWRTGNERDGWELTAPAADVARALIAANGGGG